MSRAAIEPFTPTVTEKPWGQEILVAHHPDGWRGVDGGHYGGYAGKILRRTVEGSRVGLQYHTLRDEIFHLLSGSVIVYFVDSDGLLRKYTMAPGESFHVPIGAIHSVETLTDSVMFEASCGPVTAGDAVNVEDQYEIPQAVNWP